MFSSDKVLQLFDQIFRAARQCDGNNFVIRTYENYSEGQEDYPDGALEVDLARGDGLHFTIGIEPSQVEYVISDDRYRSRNISNRFMVHDDNPLEQALQYALDQMKQLDLSHLPIDPPPPTYT